MYPHLHVTRKLINIYLCSLQASFITLSFQSVLFIYSVTNILSIFARTIITFTLLFGSVIGIFFFEILQLLNFRQHNNYFSAVQNNSGFGFLFWGILFCILLTSNRIILKSTLISIIPIGLYLLLYFINPLSARLLESYLIIIVSSICLLSKSKFYTVYGMLFIWTILNNFTLNYSNFTFYYRFRQWWCRVYAF